MATEIKMYVKGFTELWNGSRSFDLVAASGAPKKGDFVILREYTVLGMQFTGREIRARVRFAMDENPKCLQADIVALQYDIIQRLTSKK